MSFSLLKDKNEKQEKRFLDLIGNRIKYSIKLHGNIIVIQSNTYRKMYFTYIFLGKKYNKIKALLAIHNMCFSIRFSRFVNIILRWFGVGSIFE